MRGSVRRNGRKWQYVFDGPKNDKGERQQVTKGRFTTKRQAEAALRSAMAQAETAEESGASSDSPPLGEWLQATWLPSRRKLRRSDSVLAMKRSSGTTSCPTRSQQSASRA